MAKFSNSVDVLAAKWKKKLNSDNRGLIWRNPPLMHECLNGWRKKKTEKRQKKRLRDMEDSSDLKNV